MNDFIWDDTRIFLALARCGTLTMAAKTLDMSIATLSRKIERLESNLNTPLFLRFQTGYQLTEEGKNLIIKAEEMEAAVLAFTNQVTHETQLSGRIKLATAENLATHLILPELPSFQDKYPNLELDIVTDINAANLHRRDADLALRMVRPSNGNVSFRRVGTLGYGLYASASYLDKKERVNAGIRDDVIGWGENYEHLPSADWTKKQISKKLPKITTTSVATQVSACKAGLGLAVLPHLVTHDTELVCLKNVSEAEQNIYIVIQTDLAQSQRIRVVADFLTEIVEKYEDQLNLTSLPKLII